MEDNRDLGTNAIDSDPNFNFLSKILSNENEEDDFLFNNPDFSPYSETEFVCSYIGSDHYRNNNLCNDFLVLSLNIQAFQPNLTNSMTCLMNFPPQTLHPM